MTKKKRNIILASALALTVATGGTTYGVINYKQTQAKIETAKVELTDSQETLTALLDRLASYELEGGYLSIELTQETLDEVKNSLNSISESSVVYEVSDEGVKSKLEVVKTNKSQIEQEVDRLESKLAIQDSVNSLFEGAVIDGDDVTDLAIKADLTDEVIQGVEDTLTDEDEWSKTLIGLVTEAKEQHRHHSLALDTVAEHYDDENVIAKPTREGYESALTVVNKVKNETIRKDLEDQLDGVLTVIVANEKEEARLIAEAEAKAEAERQRIAQAKAEAEAEKQRIAQAEAEAEKQRVAQAEVESKKQETVKTETVVASKGVETGGKGSEQVVAKKTEKSDESSKEEVPTRTEGWVIYEDELEYVGSGVIPGFDEDGNPLYGGNRNTWNHYRTKEPVEFDPSQRVSIWD